MLLNPRENVLYIFAGQRNKEYLSDFFVYDIGATPTERSAGTRARDALTARRPV